MSGTEEEVPSEIKGGGAEKKYEEAVEKTDSVEEAESSKLEKGPSEIEGQQHVLSHLKELKIECEGGEAEKLKIECEVGEAEEKHEEAEEQRDSVEEAESSQLEEEEEDDDDEDEDEDDDDEKQDSQTMSYPDNDDDYLAEGETEVDWERWDKYDEQVKATEGFGLTVDVGLCAMAALRPVPNFKKRYNFFCELSDLAIKKFNQDNIVLGSGFEVITVGKRKLVRSVPTELNKDQNEVLELAQAQGFVTVDEVQRRLSWSSGRAIDALDTLLEEGLAMIDDGHKDRIRRYWFPCVSSISSYTGADNL